MYYITIRNEGKRTERLGVNVSGGKDTTITISLENAVEISFEDTVSIKQRPGVAMSLGSPVSVIMEDVNSDGNEDIVAGFTDNSIDIFTNESGQYVFNKRILLSSGSIRCIRAADWNNDGLLDLIAGYEDGVIKLHTQTSGLEFTPDSILFDAPSGLSSFDLEDFDFDGKAEMVLGFIDGTVHILKASGSSRTLTQMTLDGNVPCDAGNGANVLAIDVSGDGLSDVITGTSEGIFKWYRNSESGVFTDMGNLISSGAALSIGEQVSVSSVFSGIGEFKTILLADQNGYLLKANGVLNGDINGDGKVNLVDFGMFVDSWRSKQGDPEWNAKANMNLTADPVSSLQIINLSDFGKFVDVWRNEK